MKKSKKIKISAFICLFVIIIIAGFITEKNETEYKSFFVEKNVNDVSAEESAQDFVKQININTADEDELMKLEGIGEKMAKRIVKYRAENGKFEVIEDIMRVSGIGDNKFKDIKDFIVAE